MKSFVKLLVIIVGMVALIVSGCNGGGGGKGPITVGSKIDTEGALLSQMIILLLRDNGFEVVDKSSFGPTPVVPAARCACSARVTRVAHSSKSRRSGSGRKASCYREGQVACCN